MRLLRCLPLSLLSLMVSLPAAADTSIDSTLGAIGAVELSGEAEVPLLAHPDWGVMPVVKATVNGDTTDPGALFVLSTGDAMMTVTPEFVARYGLEKSKKKSKRVGEIETVQIESLTVGGLVLRDVTAVVNAGSLKGVSPTAPQQIGLALLEDAATAILPSKGVVRFAPGSAGAALVDSVGGAKVEYGSTASTNMKIGKTKGRLPEVHLQVPASIGGLQTVVTLDSGEQASTIRQVMGRDELTAAIAGPAHKRGDAVVQFADVAVGEAKASAWVRSTTAPDLSEVDEGLKPASRLGANYLAHFDVAIDPGSRTVALARVEAPKRANALPGLIEAANQLASKADAEAAEAAKEAGEPAKPAAAEWTTVAQAHLAVGQTAQAIAAWNKVLEADDTACAAHHGLGQAHVLAGDLDAAATSLSAASALYHAWWDDDIVVPGSVDADGHPSAVPRKLKATYAQAPMKNRKGEWIPALSRAWWEEAKADGDDLPDGLVPQPVSCWTADSDLAGVALAQGDGAKALEIYTAWMERYPPLRMVLDPKLATVSANARMADGSAQDAVAGLRMASQFDHSRTDPRWALGLALSYVEAGRIDSAAPLFVQALRVAPMDTVTMSLYLDALAAEGGADAAIAAAADWAQTYPTSVGAAFGMAYAASLSDTPAGPRVKAKGFATKALKQGAVLHPFDAGFHAARARTLLLLGDAAGAAEAVAIATELNPAMPAVLLASAEIDLSNGQAPKSRGQVKRAAEIAAAHPGYQLLKAGLPEKAPRDAAPMKPGDGAGKGDGKGDDAGKGNGAEKGE